MCLHTINFWMQCTYKLSKIVKVTLSSKYPPVIFKYSKTRFALQLPWEKNIYSQPLKISKLSSDNIQFSSPPSRNNTLVIAVKNCPKEDIKMFGQPFLFDFCFKHFVRAESNKQRKKRNKQQVKITNNEQKLTSTEQKLIWNK